MFFALQCIRVGRLPVAEDSANWTVAKDGPTLRSPRPISLRSQPAYRSYTECDLRPNSNLDSRILDTLACSNGMHAFVGHTSKIDDRPVQCETHTCDGVAAAAIETCTTLAPARGRTEDLHLRWSCESIVWRLRWIAWPIWGIPRSTGWHASQILAAWKLQISMSHWSNGAPVNFI